MGKSTVLQCLLLLRQSYNPNTRQVDELYLNGRYVQLGNGQDVLYEKAETEQIGFGIKSETGDNVFLFGYEPDSDCLTMVGDKCKDYSKELFGKRFSYVSAYRIEPRNLYAITNEEELLQREFGNNGEFALQYLSLYGAEPVAVHSLLIGSEKDNTLLGQTRLWLDRIAPGVSPQVTVNTQLRTSEVRYEFVEGTNKTNSYKSVNVGFGITYVLPLIIAILSAKPGELILLENPEAHIHPAGQRMLGELIARAGAGGVQLIVETHSDHLLNGIRLSVKHEVVPAEDVRIHFFYKDEDDGFRHKSANPEIRNDGRMDIWPKGFFDEWDKALYELF